MSKGSPKTEKFFLANETSSNKTFIHVKLTDSFLHKLQNHKGDGQLSFKLHGSNDGVFSLRQNGKSENYNFSLSNMDPDGPNGSYECVQETKTKNKRLATSLGQISLKMQILAKEDSYKSTKEKIVAVDKKQKKSCTKQLPGPASRLSRKRVQPVIAPVTRNLRHQDSGYTSATRSMPIRARIIHKIALKPHFRPDLLVKLISEGITDEEKAAYPGIMDVVTTSKRGKPCTIVDEVWKEIQDDWPLYSPEEAEIVHKLKLKFLDKKPDIDKLSVQLAAREEKVSSNLNISKEIRSVLEEESLSVSKPPTKRSRRSGALENRENDEALNMIKEKISVPQKKLASATNSPSQKKMRSRRSDNILKDMLKGNNKRTANKRLSSTLEVSEPEKPGLSGQMDNPSSAEALDASPIANSTEKISPDNHKISKSPLKRKTADRNSSEGDLASPSTSQSSGKTAISLLRNRKPPIRKSGKQIAQDASSEGDTSNKSEEKAVTLNTQPPSEINSICRKKSQEKIAQVLSVDDKDDPPIDVIASEIAGPTAITEGKRNLHDLFGLDYVQAAIQGEEPHGGPDIPSFEEIYHSYVDPDEEPINALKHINHLDIRPGNLNIHPKMYVVQYYSQLYHECAAICTRVNKIKNMFRILRDIYYSVSDPPRKQEVLQRVHCIVAPLTNNEKFIKENRSLKKKIKKLEELRPLVQRIHEEPLFT